MFNQWVRPELEQQCISTALFLHDFPAAVFFPIMPPLSIFLTFIIRRLALGGKIEALEAPKPEDIESSAIPASTQGGVDNETDQPPPPYHRPGSEAPVPTAPEKPAKKRSPANRFVLGTVAFTALLAAHFIWALSIQWLTFCMGELMIPLAMFFWLMYACEMIWSLVGLGSWLILLRDLWGPAAKKKYPIDEMRVAKAVVRFVAVVVTVPFLKLGSGMVGAVESCQRGCCPGALEEEEIEGAELEERRALVGAGENEWIANGNEGEGSDLNSSPSKYTK